MRIPHSCTRREFVFTSLTGIAALAYNRTAFSQETRSASDTAVQLLDLTATDAVQRLRNGDLSAERYAEVLLLQCEKQGELNAFIFFDKTRVMDEALAADRRRKAGAQ